MEREYPNSYMWDEPALAVENKREDLLSLIEELQQKRCDAEMVGDCDRIEDLDVAIESCMSDLDKM